MESNELIKSGLDAVEALISYLSKDSLGSGFLNQFLGNREARTDSVQKQRESLEKLAESSSEMENETKEIFTRVGSNSERLSKIYNEITELRTSVEKIEAEHKRYAEQFKVLMQQATDISKLMEDIQNISEQTNLLSFNASIEAAHAGTVGAGFRIIANEVKKLSGNTRKSADSIMHNIDQLKASITKLEEDTRKNVSSLSELTAETDHALQRFDKVRKLNSESNEAVEKISMSISSNMQNINALINTVQSSEDKDAQTVNLFADCASQNAMLFNDLYSFVYEIKAVLEDLRANDGR